MLGSQWRDPSGQGLLSTAARRNVPKAGEGHRRIQGTGGTRNSLSGSSGLTVWNGELGVEGRRCVT